MLGLGLVLGMLGCLVSGVWCLVSGVGGVGGVGGYTAALTVPFLGTSRICYTRQTIIKPYTTSKR